MVGSRRAKENRYGGAERIWDDKAENPSDFSRIVGRNTGSEAKDMLVKRNMEAVNHGVKEQRVCKRSRKDSERLDDACGRRRTAIRRSRGVRYDAVEGESGIRCQAQRATNREGKPSIRKSARQGVMIRVFLDKKTIAHARELAKELARGAAEMKIPTR